MSKKGYDYGQKVNKIFDCVTRYFDYFDLMDASKMYPIRGGGGLTPSSIVFFHDFKNVYSCSHYVLLGHPLHKDQCH